MTQDQKKYENLWLMEVKNADLTGKSDFMNTELNYNWVKVNFVKVGKTLVNF